MNEVYKITATLYREDPQFKDKFGVVSLQLKSSDAYILVETIPFSIFSTKVQIEIYCIERQKDHVPILPIQDKLGLEFKFLEANGMLFTVLGVDIEDSKNRIFKIMIDVDPNHIESEILQFLPLTAHHIGKNMLKLEQSYNYVMSNPYCLRESGIHDARMIKLNRKNDNSDFFSLTDDTSDLKEHEIVKIIPDWNPGAIKRKKN